ncbi:lytic murein transglycosylase [Rhodopseudomonas julia]|uniref:Lytic murein transglycosylase n=1 Tax=Rhodopseudomonas julia TaxID=200617 RepID=A0ABU0C3J1_9BRAD|nr:lytic murein transglycosylase [Rhodopseudomonas julia]MDQ0324812.1 lytic murein transglycosylase [Rhodopseudomonas julia]
MRNLSILNAACGGRAPRRAIPLALLTCLCLVLSAGGSSADTACRKGQSFDAWLKDFTAEGARKGLTRRSLSEVHGLSLDSKVLANDRGQPSLSLSFTEFADRLISRNRLSRGRAMLDRYASTFAAIERDFGVQGPVLAAFWGLETDFGGYMGEFSSLRSLATLAYDCRRSELFREELLAALVLLERGDLTPEEMRGAWAGEIGQVQFTPSNYLKFGLDYDGDGRRDLVKSVPDALASAAKFLRHLGWRANEPWLEEVEVGPNVPWDKAGRGHYRSRADWARDGVRRRGGERLPADRVDAALVLPMGRDGPAFLAYRNFDIFWEWNNSSNYSLAAAYFATRLAGAPPMRRGNPAAMLSSKELLEVQTRLNRLGYDAGPPDGRLGQKTRTGVRAAQLAFGLPADGYPTRALLERLRRQ